ncbi:MAG: LicD family protein [Bacteroidales bacterium]|nr:LicD family protein [Bacteroidales bacterium]
MERLTLRQIQEILLEILSDVDACCSAHGIRYSLAFGTLLGAVRHGGFIPWDDDVDIIMPRADFDRFTALYPRSDHRYHLLYNTRTADEFYALGFAKVHDPQTSKFVGERRSLFRYGVSVDIFPLDAVPDDDAECLSYMKELIHLHRRLYFRHKRFPYGSPFTLLESRLRSFDAWWEACDRLARKYDSCACRRVAHILGSNTFESVHDKALFDDLAPVSFEGRSFPAFRDTHAYLSQVFGPDYMTPPPPEQRHGHDCNMYRL